MSSADDKADDLEVQFGDAIDMMTFSQILEMDDPGDNEFSREIVFGFFQQAEETFQGMDDALDAQNLIKLSELGHYLKGSSATLGLNKVRDGCEKIQRYGKNENLDGSPETDNALCLKRIDEVLRVVKKDYDEVERLLKKYYEDHE